MTHVMGLGATMKTNECLWQSLDIGNMCEPNVGSKNSQHIQFKDLIQFCMFYDFGNLLDLYLHVHGKFAQPYASPDLVFK